MSNNETDMLPTSWWSDRVRKLSALGDRTSEHEMNYKGEIPLQPGLVFLTF